MQTRICRLYGKGDIRIETVELEPPRSGEVLVMMGAGGVCGSDLHYFQDGGFGPIRVKEPIGFATACGAVECLFNPIELF